MRDQDADTPDEAAAPTPPMQVVAWAVVDEVGTVVSYHPSPDVANDMARADLVEWDRQRKGWRPISVQVVGVRPPLRRVVKLVEDD